ncbi:MAG: HNH endonuclease [Eggerthellaceae bacterium]|nr:HNH endonuclease [Eggerthellaceae bacterium]
MPTRPDSLPAAARMRWSSRPEETAWMLENDKGRPIIEVIDDFERAFGVRLNRYQVSAFRSSHGTQSRRSHGGGKPRVPIGYERETKGYVVVKVGPEANVPQSKDNWKLKHVHVWEQHNGPLPKGWTVLFADRNTRNFDPDNLVAIPRAYMGQLNFGYDWHDRETLEAAIACVKLRSAIVDAENRPRPCGVCGRDFTPPANLRWSKVNTCPECLSQGKKSYVMHGRAGEGECAVCGKTFSKDKPFQRRCRECIAEAPKHGVDTHLRKKRAAQAKGEPA